MIWINQKLLKIILTLTILVQLIQLYLFQISGQPIYFSIILLLIWICLRIVCACLSLVILKQKKLRDYLKQFLIIFITFEIHSLVSQKFKNDVRKCTLGFILQQYLYLIPTLLVNQFVVLEDSIQNNHFKLGFYLVILVNLIVLSFCNFLSIETNRIHQKNKLSFLSYIQIIIRPILFWYLLSQVAYFSYHVIIFWFTVNALLGLAISSRKQDSSKIAYFLSFILSIEINLIQTEDQIDSKIKEDLQATSKNDKINLQDWSDVFYNFMIQLSLAMFLFVKLLFNLNSSNLEGLISLLYIFLLPNLISSIISICSLARKIENYKDIINWQYGKLNLRKIICYLSQNLQNEGKVYINMEEIRIKLNECLLDKQVNQEVNEQSNKNVFLIKKKDLFQDLKEIQSALLLSKQGKFKSLLIHFFDLSQNIQILILIDQNNQSNYKVVLKPGFDQQFAVQIIDFIQYILDPNNPIIVQISEKILVDLRIQSIRFQRDCLVQNTQHKKLIEGILSNNFQAFAYYKHIADYIPLNPQLVLYDLFDD